MSSKNKEHGFLSCNSIDCLIRGTASNIILGGGQWRNGEFDKWKRQIRHRHFSPFFAIIRHFSPLVVFEIKHFRH